MWSEADDTVTRVSAGPGAIGDTDNCNSSWIAGCSVEVVPSLRGIGFNTLINERGAIHGGATTIGHTLSDPTDNSVAGNAGDIYFYSPEQFVGEQGHSRAPQPLRVPAGPDPVRRHARRRQADDAVPGHP